MSTTRACSQMKVVRPANNEAFNTDLAAALAALTEASLSAGTLQFVHNRHILAVAGIPFTQTLTFADLDEYAPSAYASASGALIHYEAVNAYGATPNLETPLNDRLTEIQKMLIYSGSGSTLAYYFAAAISAVTLVSDQVAVIKWIENPQA